MEDDDDDLYGSADIQHGHAQTNGAPANDNQPDGEEGEAMEDESDDSVCFSLAQLTRDGS